MKNGRLRSDWGAAGAPIQNLQNLEADLIFIKNIDNIVPEALQKKILPYKKMLGGWHCNCKKSAFEMLRRLEKNGLRGMNLKQSQNFAVKNWAGTFLKDYLETFPAGKTAGALWHLDRPMRICGIVRNEGELGGAPFWVREEDGSKTSRLSNQLMSINAVLRKKISGQRLLLQPC